MGDENPDGGLSALTDVLGMTEDELREASHDAMRYRWLVRYMVSDRQDLDDVIVAAKTKAEYDIILDKDMMASTCAG